ncbi:hypothetical protein LY76DRAFT_587123 [Colletotrichum caudatum]|nr:hypothetical protein LY76DRAFT_587123 [Colletotrichum caudatum]
MPPGSGKFNRGQHSQTVVKATAEPSRPFVFVSFSEENQIAAGKPWGRVQYLPPRSCPARSGVTYGNHGTRREMAGRVQHAAEGQRKGKRLRVGRTHDHRVPSDVRPERTCRVCVFLEHH